MLNILFHIQYIKYIIKMIFNTFTQPIIAFQNLCKDPHEFILCDGFDLP